MIMKRFFIILTAIGILTLVFTGCSSSTASSGETESNNTTEEKTKNPETPPAQPVITLSYAENTAYCGEALELGIAFENFASNPEKVDIYTENSTTVFASNVAVNAGKVNVDISRDYFSNTLKFYAKSNTTESNHVSIFFDGYSIPVLDLSEEFVNSLSTTELIKLRLTGFHENFKDAQTNILKNSNLRLALDLSKITSTTNRTQFFTNFKDFTYLESIILPDYIKVLPYFTNCKNLTDIKMADDCFLRGHTGSNSGIAFFNQCEKLTTPIKIQGGTIIPSSTFYNCKNLTEVYIPDSIESIEYYVFYNCIKLEQLNLPSNLIAIWDEAFKSSGIKEITIPASVNSIGKNAFYITSLEKVTFENTAGWKAGDIEISASDLEDPETAANLLKNTYRNANWTRSQQ